MKQNYYDMIIFILVIGYWLYFVIPGFLPVWNETVRFDVLVPDLALVRFQVMDECSGADPLLAQVLMCLPFTSIREGTCYFMFYCIQL